MKNGGKGGRMDERWMDGFPAILDINLRSDCSIQALSYHRTADMTKLKIPSGSNPSNLLVSSSPLAGWSGCGTRTRDRFAGTSSSRPDMQIGGQIERGTWRLKPKWLLLSITPHKSCLSVQTARCVGLHFHNCICWGKRRTYSYFQLRFIKASDSSRHTRSFISAMTFIWAGEPLPSLFFTFCCLRSPLLTLCWCGLTTITDSWELFTFPVKQKQTSYCSVVTQSKRVKQQK